MNPNSAADHQRGPLIFLALGFLRLYQLLISPWLGAHCRFEPSCSQYAMDAISRNGLWRGTALAARRLSRCHPFHEGGFDPAP